MQSSVPRAHEENPSRFDILAEELDNLPMVALRNGFDPSLFSPMLKAKYAEAAARHGASSTWASSPSHKEQLSIETTMAGAPALEDGRSDLQEPPAGGSAAPPSMPTATKDSKMDLSDHVTAVLPALKLPKKFNKEPDSGSAKTSEQGPRVASAAPEVLAISGLPAEAAAVGDGTPAARGAPPVSGTGADADAALLAQLG